MKRITRRCAAWIACLAMLFAALAPSISHAMAASRGDGWAEICSAAGVKYIKANVIQSTTVDPVTEQTVHLEHCPFCATHAGSFALLPPVSGISIPVLDLPDSHPPLFFQSPRPLAVWTSAQSRAPPASV
ncbi:MAG: DUF2946 domain-containing protein [Massilia sp.]